MHSIIDKHTKISIRPAAVAGMFYPVDAAILDADLDELLTTEPSLSGPVKALVVPHAGYIYSGPVAATAYANLFRQREQITRVVLLGPAHRVFVEGAAIPTNTHFASPLGNIPLDTEALASISDLPFVQYMDVAHRDEHSLEVHLPFLQKTLDQFVLIPIVIGNAAAEQVASLLEQLWGEQETLIVVSSDLSHYHDYQHARKIDAETTRLIEGFAYQDIKPEQACGCMPLRGLLKVANAKNMSLETLDLRNSGDTAGPRDKVVGYGAYALCEQRILSTTEQSTVFELMRQSIQRGLDGQGPLQPDRDSYQDSLCSHYAVFVTLKKNGQLRGCIGNTHADRPLTEAVCYYAHAAAFNDPRFAPLCEDEWSETTLSLSILTPATAIQFDDEADLIGQLRPGHDGLIIEKNGKKATFLPVVWETLPEPARFMTELKKKAGMAASECPAQAWRYTAEYYE